MAESFDLGVTLRLNAWTGDAAPAGTLAAKQAASWALKRQTGGPLPLAAEAMAPVEAPEWDWKDARVGWGLILPDNPALSPAALAHGDDAPAPLRQLLAARPGSPVLRWNAAEGHARLLRYGAAGTLQRLSMVGSEAGIGPGQLPRYLLIAASPTAIPWSFQYAANLSHFVGRIDLDGEALGRYVGALIAGWKDAAADPRAPLVWSVDHGQPDITWLMDQAVSRKLFAAFAADATDDLSRRRALFGADATSAALIDALVAQQPALVVSTSHGMTGPLDDPALMIRQLGVPVDHAHQVVDLDTLVERRAPDGAIWYSHACCAAGSDSRSAYGKLFDAGSSIPKVLDGVAAICGARVAPLPQRLLGAMKPLRAFVGHVEPTFDWTLRDPHTGQPLRSSLRRVFYDGLYAGGGGRPLGWALSRVFDDAGAMLAQWTAAFAAFNDGLPKSLAQALYFQLTALDRQHTVILGDPTVALPNVSTVP